MRIRPAGAADLERLRAIEVAAGASFRALGMAAVADDDPPTVTELTGYAEAGPAWVVEQDGAVAGYLLDDVVDGRAHVEQVSVHPDHAGHGLGRALIEHLAERARAAGRPALTLTTYRDVPWNGPYYRRLGFRELAAGEETPGLRALRAEEAARGLDRWPRCGMCRELGPSGAP